MQTPSIVCDTPGYNAWPMIQAIGGRLVCAYTRGTAHDIVETVRGTYARVSDDGGKTWSPEVEVVNTPDFGDSPIGKGLDADGAMLLWVRSWRYTPGSHHVLYRTTDGVHYTVVSQPRFDPVPMQLTDIFEVPGTGLMSLWFAGEYHEGNRNFWGTAISRDNGRSWSQQVMESGVPFEEWATEPAAFYAGDGRIFCIARTEKRGGAQFQMESVDSGRTWIRRRTNIDDVFASTPSLVYDRQSGMIRNYYFYRGTGLLKRRTAALETVWDNPCAWPEPEVLVTDSTSPFDAGNVNAVRLGETDYLAYYAGDSRNTSIRVARG